MWQADLAKLLGEDRKNLREEIMYNYDKGNFYNVLTKILPILSECCKRIDDLETYKNEIESDVDLYIGKVQSLNKENEKLKKQQKPEPFAPALRKDLDVEKLYAMYNETGSLSQTAKAFNCERKTVKNRLIKAGYIQ